MPSRLTRRELLRLLPAGGAAAAATGAWLWLRPGRGDARVVDGVCRLCVMRCGIRGTVEDGRLVAGMAGKGRSLIVIDPVRTPLAEAATLHLAVRPGTDGALALSMIQVVVEEGLHDAAFVRDHTVGFEDLAAAAAKWPLGRAAEVTGVDPGRIRLAARLFAGRGPSSV